MKILKSLLLSGAVFAASPAAALTYIYDTGDLRVIYDTHHLPGYYLHNYHYRPYYNYHSYHRYPHHYYPHRHQHGCGHGHVRQHRGRHHR